MGAGLLLCAIPVDVKRGIHALDLVERAKDVVAWDVLLLFGGGGLTMAAAIQSMGAASLIGAQAALLAGTSEITMMAGVAHARDLRDRSDFEHRARRHDDAAHRGPRRKR